MNKPFDIVLMVGMPGSGKTTFCRERLFPSHLYISLDREIPIFTSPDSAEWWSRFLRSV